MENIDDTHPTRRISKHIKNLFLDPNNYRFVDNDKYVVVPDNQVLNENIQRRTRNFIEGTKRDNIKDLIASFKSNGFLNVDVIQLKDLGDNSYLVLEGNRRVTALKALQEDYEQGHDIGNLNPSIFKSIPSEIHGNEDQNKHTIIMGLKHIRGNKPWPAINQAKLVHDYLSTQTNSVERNQKEQELANSLGVSIHWIRATQRAYSLILQYKKSDYSDQFKSEMYSLFLETVKRPAIKEWLNWNDATYKAENSVNLERFFSWISDTEIESDEQYSFSDNLSYGEALTETVEPIITKSHEIRDLANFIENDSALREMENTRSLARGLAKSGIIEKETYKKSLQSLTESLEQLVRYQDLITSSEVEEINKAHEKLLKIIPKTSNISIKRDDYSVCFKTGEVSHFSDLNIQRYKSFSDFNLSNLNRINILAGANNTGKTSLLEAIYLLTKQNDIAALFELVKLRNKLETVNPEWLKEYISDNSVIKGTFNGITTQVSICKFDATEIDKKDDYVISYRINSTIDTHHAKAIVHTFGFSDTGRFNDKIELLCKSTFKSPYFYDHKEVIDTYTSTLETKIGGSFAIAKLISFLKNVDSKINDIRLGSKSDLDRFYVDASNFPDSTPDLTTYGEGLQRIWEIALAFAYARNGVILIDELETAIHRSLLNNFTKFIQELAQEFNTQVFITSHSKECIDAFIYNKYRLEDISVYTLIRSNNKLGAKYNSGRNLHKMLDMFNADVRGYK